MNLETKYLRKIIFLLPSSIFFFIVVPLMTYLIGVRLDIILDFPRISSNLWITLTILVLFGVGCYFIIESIRVLFVKGRGVPLGDLIQSDQSEHLITIGVYERTRNPMLFGYILVLCGLGLIAKSLSGAIILPGVYLVLWILWLKIVEEPSLEDRFGDEYKDYRESTPFLVPR